MTDPAGSATPSGARSFGRARTVSAALASAAVLIGSVACGPSSHPKPQAIAATTPPAAPTTTPATTAAPSPTPAAVVWPLTGVQTTALADRPALAVKIENSITARPQTGLDAADLVFEEVVEGGITRYVAVYHSNLPPEIGPGRSIRPMDAAIAGPLHGVMAFSGGIQSFITAAAKAGLQLVSDDGGGRGFHRISGRPAPHNLYADPSALVAQADAAHEQAPPTLFDFAAAGAQPTAATAGTPATALHLTLSGVSHPTWTWNAADGRWLRAEASTPAIGADGTQLGATNVVVLRVQLVNTASRDPANNPVPDTLLAGTGTALVASAGHTVPATWTKGGAADRLVLSGADGQPVQLAPGNTWIELVPVGTGAVSAG